MIRLGLALDKQSFLYELGEIKILVSHPGNVRLSSSWEKVGVRVGSPWHGKLFTLCTIYPLSTACSAASP